MESRVDMTKFVPLLLMIVLFVSGCTGTTPGTAPASTSTIVFTVPEELPSAKVGVPYSFSFATAANPTGGHPPYSFLLGSGVGFPPFGLILNVNGTLSGTPTATGTRTFEVYQGPKWKSGLPNDLADCGDSTSGLDGNF